MLSARIKKQLGPHLEPALNIDVNLVMDRGVAVLFGPSGAGKTTILRIIAGVMAPDEGRITLDQAVYFDSDAQVSIPIQQRRVGYVFQNHALFPHMTAEQNILYGARAPSHSSARKRVHELMSMLAIQKTGTRYPHELSGGEQQRIAIARALASDPLIMLLDEPLSAVDVATRSRLLEEISTVQRRAGIPFLYVTHNHSEAARVGDTMFAIHEGKVVQEGIPLEIFNAPKTAPASRIVGSENVFLGEVLSHRQEDGITTIGIQSYPIEAAYNGLPLGSQITIGIRSEDIIVSCERLTQTSARNVLEGSIKNIISAPDRTELVVDCGIDFKVSITSATVRALKLEIGTKVFLLVKARAFHILP